MNSLRIVQITDPHLYASTSTRLLGINTLESFDWILESARSLTPLHMLLATGDLVHDQSVIGYQRLRCRLASLGLPVFCLPGNHDDPQLMTQILNQGKVRTIASTQMGDWSLIFLDSTLPDSEGGHLGDQALQLLESCLEAHPDKHTLVCLHHHPLPVGSVWMDQLALDNPKPFFSIIDRHPQVRGILCGHIHQEFEADRRGVRILGTPSTCVQFAPRRDEFTVDALAPGYRWLDLLADGRITSGVTRLDAYPSSVDLRSAGY